MGSKSAIIGGVAWLFFSVIFSLILLSSPSSTPRHTQRFPAKMYPQKNVSSIPYPVKKSSTAISQVKINGADALVQTKVVIPKKP